MLRVIAKNFRGFKSIDYVLNDSNILVGGNSSGKTSFLYLIQLITSSEFRQNFEFLTTKKIKGYDDIVSPYTRRGVITFGYIFEDDDDKEHSDRYSRDYILMDVRPLPGKKLEVAKLSISNGVKSIFVKRDRGRLVRKVVDLAEKGGVEYFIKEHSVATKGYSGEFIPESFGSVAEAQSLQMSTLIFDEKNRRVDTSLIRPGTVISPIFYGPMRSAPLHYYHEYGWDFEETGRHTPAILRDMHEEGRLQENSVVKSLNSFGKLSGLFDEVDVKLLSGADRRSPYRIVFKKNNQWFTIDELGYGVSQVLPLLVDALLAAIDPEKKSLIAVQQPEVHLHPQAQAEFGGLLHKLTMSGVTFVIETHSDFIIDRFRLAQSASKEKAKSSILYFHNDKDGNKMESITIENDGSMGDTPEGYREFFSREQDKMFSMI